MTDYAIVNLLEIDDSLEGRLPGLEGRFSRKYLGLPRPGRQPLALRPEPAQPGQS